MIGLTILSARGRHSLIVKQNIMIIGPEGCVNISTVGPEMIKSLRVKKRVCTGAFKQCFGYVRTSPRRLVILVIQAYFS